MPVVPLPFPQCLSVCLLLSFPRVACPYCTHTCVLGVYWVQRQLASGDAVYERAHCSDSGRALASVHAVYQAYIDGLFFLFLLSDLSSRLSCFLFFFCCVVLVLVAAFALVRGVTAVDGTYKRYGVFRLVVRFFDFGSYLHTAVSRAGLTCTFRQYSQFYDFSEFECEHAFRESRSCLLYTSPSPRD